MMRNRLIRIVKRIGVALLSFSLTLAALEVGIRIVAPGSLRNQNYRTYDPNIGYKFLPNLDTTIDTGEGPHRLVTNEYGFVGTSFPLQKPANEWRIVNIGDSYTEGVQEVDWDKGFVTLLGERLAAHSPSDAGTFRSLNFGFSGRGTLEEYWSYKYLAYQTNPDLVILWFNLSNDFANNYLPSQPQTALEANAYGTIKYLLKKSALATFVFERVKGNPAAIRVLQRLHLTNAVYEEGTSGEPSIEDKINYSVNPADAGKQERAYSTTKDLLKDFRDETRAHGTRFLVAIIPLPFNDVSEFRERFFSLYLNARPEQYDFSKSDRVLKEMLAALEIEYLDLADGFRAYAEGRSGIPDCGTVWGDHFSACGHRVTAEVVGKYIADNILSPRR